MTDKRKILFLCTGNSCRSQMAEAMLRRLGGERFESLSAGSRPAGFVHPLAIEVMWRLELPIEDQVSKSWDEFTSISVDVVITLCDHAAKELCPTWPGSPITAHWPLPDPTCFLGSEEERLAFAVRVAERLRAKIGGLIGLDFSARPEELHRRLQFLGEI